jgi:exo-1,4-beta-D-glucosaminidase
VLNPLGAMVNENSRLTRLLGALPVLLALFAVSALSFAESPEGASSKLPLHSGWMLQSSCRTTATGGSISTQGFDTDGWHATTVPSTVVAALVADKTFRDPYFGNNLRSIPGASYPIGDNFALLPMPKESPFRCSWWYRTEFRLPESYAGRHIWLNFDGINNRANIWVNGHKIAGAQEVAGAYRTYEFDITSRLNRDGANVLAAETIAQTERDLGINWVDWNPAPPDKDMGLWREVYVRATGPVTIRHSQVVTHFPGSFLDRADLTVEAEVSNAGANKVAGTLLATIEALVLRQTVALMPGETRTIRFTPDKFPQLGVRNPKLWWPRQMGEANLHTLSVRFLLGDEVSDSEAMRFGIREMTSQLDERGHRLFRVNGKPILIRGGGWAPDMLLRESPARLRQEFRYLRELNLNAIRLEGKMESDDFYTLADEQGVLIMAGWSCCDFWEQWPRWKPTDLAIASASLRSQIMRMRSHPSMLVWLNGSDNPPPAKVEKAYVQVLEQADWPNPYISSASKSATTVTEPSGVKMTGPYDYVPPDYWLVDAGRFGGAYGFNTEASPGPAIPPLGSLRQMLPANAIHPDDPVWNFHAGLEGFKDLSHFEEAMKAIYGAPRGLDDYELKSQAMAYDGERAMFESYSRNKYSSTGIIQWMLNNAWPSLIWHLYDYYLEPAGGYFGTKKACEPLHVQYSYDDRSVAVVNSTYENADGLTARAKLYDLDLRERFSGRAATSVAADGVARVLTLPQEAFNPPSPVYFVALTLENGGGQVVSTNFYWLSRKKNAYAWEKTTYQSTPVASYEDFTSLQALPKAGMMTISARVDRESEGPLVRVRLENPSEHLAFQVRLGINRRSEETDILPVLWNDNYIELLPKQSREITARFLAADAFGRGAELSVSGWNIEPRTVPLGEPSNTAAPSGGSRR